MRELYKLSTKEKPDNIGPYPCFQDYVEHGQEYQNSPQFIEDKTYWEQKLAQDLEPISFFGKSPAKKSGRMQSITRNLGADRTKKLKAIATQDKFAHKSVDVALFNIVFGLFSTYLYRISGNKILSIGIPFLNRNAETFIQVAPLIIKIANGETFTSLIKKTQTESRETYRHRLYNVSNANNNLYDVLFNFHNIHYSNLELPPLQEEWIHSKNNEFSLSFHLRCPDEENITLQFDFHQDVFNEIQQKQAAGQFLRVLDTFLKNQNHPLDSVSLLSPDERHLMLTQWNDTKAEYPKDKCVHELFQQQVERTPNAVALVFKDQQLTFSQLNNQANQLAHHLISQGIGPNVRVGICIERSLEMVVAMFAVIKTGAAYVPLDPAYPQDRLLFMVDDSRASVLLTKKRWANKFGFNIPAFCLDTDWSHVERQSKKNPASIAAPQDPIYVVYTSGSTGTPKGVPGLHQGTVNRLAWMWQAFPFESGEVACIKTTLSFVDSIWEIFGPLLQGIKTIVIPDEAVKDVSLMIQALADYKVTRTVMVPSLLQVILDSSFNLQQKLPHLKYWTTSGEVIPTALAARFYKRLPDRILLNLYGSSEVAADATWYQVGKETTPASIPIGRPIDNTQIYILDKHLQPVPTGMMGELHVGGDNLARGYLGHPALTGEKFIPDPFGHKPGSRLYKTGDLARYLPDGNIEYVGRVDHQVKIRGNRIELNEIETVLNTYPAVAKNVVIVSQDTSGEKSLVAYVVSGQTPPPASNQLRSFLNTKLPDYMIPSTFVNLKSLPLTPNGKINRRALPSPPKTRQMLDDTFVAPTNRMELQLAKIWEKLLGIHPISTTENFFNLGGHSIMAVRLFSQIEKTLGQNLPLATLLQAPTIKELAAVLQDKGWPSQWASLVPIHPSGSRPPFFCVHGIGGNVLSLYKLGHLLGPDQPFYALQAQVLDGKPIPPTTIQEIAAHYLKEIYTMQASGPYFLGGSSAGGVIAFEMAQQLIAQGKEVALLALIDTYRPGHHTQLKASVSLGKRIGYHLSEFSQSGSSKLIKQVNQSINLRKERVKNKIIKTINSFYLSIGRPMPHSRRYVQIRDAMSKSIKNYNPSPFPGRVTLFRAGNHTLGYIGNERDPDHGWGRLAEGGLEIYEIPGDHNLAQEPFVKILAEKLADCLPK